MDWTAYRRLFPALERWVYLNTSGGSAVSARAAAAGRQYFDEIERDGDTPWEQWLARTEGVRARVASLLHCDSSEVALVSSASLAMNLVCQLMGEAGGVLASRQEFPSNTLPWMQRSHRVTFLPVGDDGAVDLQAARRAVTPEMKYFVASHVQYHTGFRHDLEELAAFCSRHALTLILDVTQSAGVYPLDVRRHRIPALFFSSYKFVAAGYGVAALYVNREMFRTRRLPMVGWRSARDPHAMIEDRLELADTVSALELGHPNFPAIFALGAALELLDEIGIERIQQRIEFLTDLLHQRLRSAGLHIASCTDAGHRSPITLIELPSAGSAAQRLRQQGIFVDSHHSRLRVSLHFYNNESDIERFIWALRALA